MEFTPIGTGEFKIKKYVERDYFFFFIVAQVGHHLPCFILWGVEEIGLLGSKAYTAKHKDELNRIRFYLNMDGAGGVTPKDIMLHEWPDLQATFEGYRDQMAMDFAIGQSFHTASDHYPLLLAGVATGGIEAVRPECLPEY